MTAGAQIEGRDRPEQEAVDLTVEGPHKGHEKTKHTHPSHGPRVPERRRREAGRKNIGAKANRAFSAECSSHHPQYAFIVRVHDHSESAMENSLMN